MARDREICTRCSGGCLELDDFTACIGCRGRGWTLGRPEGWPAPGAVLRSTETLDYFVIRDGHEWADAGLIGALKNGEADQRVLIRAEHVGSSLLLDENATTEEARSDDGSDRD